MNPKFLNIVISAVAIVFAVLTWISSHPAVVGATGITLLVTLHNWKKRLLQNRD